jgi:F-type H+-transporting ATPase subunit delta
MTDSRAAKRYARALFSAAQKQSAVEAIDADLKAVTAAIAGNDAFKTLLFSPVTSDKDKSSIVSKSLSGAHELTQSLFQLLIKKSREQDIFSIQLTFEELKREQEGIVKALIESAFPLSDTQKSSVVAKVASATGRTVDAEYAVNEDLLAGVRVTYDNFVLDGTARGQLDRMKEGLLYDLLKQS